MLIRKVLTFLLYMKVLFFKNKFLTVYINGVVGLYTGIGSTIHINGILELIPSFKHYTLTSSYLPNADYSASLLILMIGLGIKILTEFSFNLPLSFSPVS